MWIDDQLVMDYWQISNPTVREATVHSGAVGQAKKIRIDYYDNVGYAKLGLNWVAPGQSGGTRSRNRAEAPVRPEDFDDGVGVRRSRGQDREHHLRRHRARSRLRSQYFRTGRPGRPEDQRFGVLPDARHRLPPQDRQDHGHRRQDHVRLLPGTPKPAPTEVP
ncbi:hypothetical protein ACWED2_44325 [Amycolatopsis sp. NPDC005003]